MRRLIPGSGLACCASDLQTHGAPACPGPAAGSHGMSSGSILLVGIGLLVALLGLASCSDDVLSPEDVRSRAIAAIEQADAWKITIACPDGVVLTEWWSSEVPDRRWDFAQHGESTQRALDEGIYYHSGPTFADSAAYTDPVFSSYLFYLKEGKGIEVSSSPEEITVLFTDYAGSDRRSTFTVSLSSGSYRPFAFLETRDNGTVSLFCRVAMEAITFAELEAAVEEAKAKPDSCHAP